VALRVNGEPRATLRPGERAAVLVHVQLERSVSRPRLTLVLRDSRGYNLFVLDSDDTPVPLDARGEARGCFEFDCRLEPGDFVVSVKLEGEVNASRGELLDKQNEAAVFRVVSTRRFRGGVIDLDGSFSLTG
jgi:lipopolysaccharide transport system ATP-binding protein